MTKLFDRVSCGRMPFRVLLKQWILAKFLCDRVYFWPIFYATGYRVGRDLPRTAVTSLVNYPLGLLYGGESNMFMRFAGCEIKTMELIFKTEMLIRYLHCFTVNLPLGSSEIFNIFRITVFFFFFKNFRKFSNKTSNYGNFSTC